MSTDACDKVGVLRWVKMIPSMVTGMLADMQMDCGRELNVDVKQETLAVMKALKKFRYYLTSVDYILEVNFSALIQLLNKLLIVALWLFTRIAPSAKQAELFCSF